MMRKKVWIGSVVVALAAGGAAVAVFASKGEAPKSKPDDEAPVALEFQAGEVVKPLSAAMSDVIEFSGPLVAPGTVIVKTKAAGTLLQLAVAEGSRVSAGQSLGTVDLEELRYRVAERQASVASAQAQFAQAERQHQANQSLADQKFIAATALETSKASLEAARATLAAAKAQLDTSQVALRQAALVAPISGVVAKRFAVPGEKLSPEQQVLSIVDLSRLELAGLVGTHEVSRLRTGLPVQVRIEGVDQAVEARIGRIAPAAEPGTRSIGVTLELANPKELYRAGQYAVARVQLPDPTERLTVPVAALSHVGGQEQVWLIEQGALVRRIVTTGRRDASQGRVEVLKGLDAQSQVLAARFDNLREGQKASVIPGKASVAAASASAAVN